MNLQTDVAISLRAVEKTYADFVLHPLDLELPTGQIMGLVGANGAGKSTIMRILMGLIRADAGEVEVCGHRLPEAQVVAKRDVGYASEDMRLYKTQTLRWHMDFIQGIFPEWDETYAAQLLKRFDLKSQQKLGGFSHGQRVKAALLLSDLVAERQRQLDATGLDAQQPCLQVLHHALALEALINALEQVSRGRSTHGVVTGCGGLKIKPIITTKISLRSPCRTSAKPTL